MIIGFDAKRAFSNRTGLGNYSRGVLHNLARYYPENDYRLYAPIPGKSLFQESSASSCLHAVHPSDAWGKVPSLWRTLAMGRAAAREKVDIFHGLSHELPFSGLKRTVAKVVTIHDLIPFRHPKQYPILDGFIYRTKMRHSCLTADLIVAISAQTRDDIQHFLAIPEEKIRVVYQSCADAFRAEIPEAEQRRVSAAYGLPKRYLLSVGSVTERKNLLTTAKAMAALSKHDVPPLVVVGQGGAYLEKVRAYVAGKNLEKQFIFLGHLPLEDLPPLYNGATALLYPSLFEGFGIPIIESLSCGTPVVTSHGSCFSETAGKGALYVDPLDAGALAAAVKAVSGDAELRTRLAAAGAEHVKRFHPQVVTDCLMRVYREALEAIGSRP